MEKILAFFIPSFFIPSLFSSLSGGGGYLQAFLRFFKISHSF